jgi:hypothetical protein
VRTPRGWLLHCGDAYFHHAEIGPQGRRAPPGIRWFESMVNFDKKARLANQGRLSELARLHGGEVTLICSHDPAELAACRSASSGEAARPSSLSVHRQDGARAPRKAS